MLEIRRQGLFRPRYLVSDEQGGRSVWVGRFGREGGSGVIAGDPYEMQRDGRKRFVLMSGRRELAVATRSGRVWQVRAGDARYELRRPSIWRSRMELTAAHGAPLGSIYRQRRAVKCDLPAELSPPLRAFLGFVAIALWNREASSAGAGATAASGG